MLGVENIKGTFHSQSTKGSVFKIVMFQEWNNSMWFFSKRMNEIIKVIPLLLFYTEWYLMLELPFLLRLTVIHLQFLEKRMQRESINILLFRNVINGIN